MKIEIRKNKNGKVAALVSFDCHSDKFDSNYERNKFFRGLYGWKQVIKKRNTIYKYKREGLLDEIPHIKVDNSVFIVAMKEMERILNYMRKWEDKIDYKAFKVLLGQNRFKKLKKEEKKGKEIEIK